MKGGREDSEFDVVQLLDAIFIDLVVGCSKDMNPLVSIWNVHFDTHFRFLMIYEQRGSKMFIHSSL